MEIEIKKCVECPWLRKINDRKAFCVFAGCVYTNKKKYYIFDEEETDEREKSE